MSDAAAATPTHDDHDHAHGDHAHGDHPPGLQHQFDTPIQQFDAAKLGMWAFLAQEILFFSGLFVAYGIFRSWYPEAFSAGSHQLNRFMGGLNTIVLLFSSLTAALAVRSSQTNEKGKTRWYLLVTIACAFAFLGIKFFEYKHKFEAGLLPGRHFQPNWHEAFAHGVRSFPEHTSTFYSVYFMMTGLHGVHVLVGIGVLIWMVVRNEKNEFSNRYFTPVDVAALYWHLVDFVWIYLFPLLYLID